MMNKYKILIVDDKPANLLVLEGVLKNPQLELIRAHSGNEALSLTLKNDLALILLDVQMPEMNGFEVAKYLRGNKQTKHIPIIFVTAISREQQYIFEGYDSGAVDYLLKPIEPVVLRNKVRVFCLLYQQKKQLLDQLLEISKKNKLLEEQYQEIKVLRGCLPICSSCKKIRDKEGGWEYLEDYISDRSEAEFTHDICPDCRDELFRR
jgi:two-component system cell cycle response regulator